MKYNNQILVVLAVATTGFSAVPVYADAISPQIKERGKSYSTEKPDISFYGTGIGGRAMEASALRFEVERLLQDGEIDRAIPKARKATQLDPSDPECHVLLARCLTRKFYSQDGDIDEKLLKECLYEWRMIWFHSSDQWEQREAKVEARRMQRIAKTLMKKREEEAKARQLAKEELAKMREREAVLAAKEAKRHGNKPAVAATGAGASPAADTKTAIPVGPSVATPGELKPEIKTAPAPVKPTSGKEVQADSKTTDSPTPIAEKKKRFGVF